MKLIFNIELQKLKELARKAADVIEHYEYARVISHNDADGLSSAGIICQALMRKGVHFHLTITPKLDAAVVDKIIESVEDKDLVIFCDMGSGHTDYISPIKNTMLIFDHHVPVGDSPAEVIVNPHLAGIDGAMHISASGVCYLVAKEMDKDNVDLAGLAIAGAVGDKQLMNTVNGSIIKEAVDAGVISIRKGLKIGDGDISQVLNHTPEPYLDITGRSEMIDEFLDILGLKGEVQALSDDDMKKLTSAVALKLAKKASPEAIDAAIGDVYVLEKELVRNVYDMVAIMNACGRMDKSAMALAICMKDNMHLKEAEQLTIEYQRSIVDNINKAVDKLQQGQNIWYLIEEEMRSTGMIASTVVRYINPDMPFVAINQVGDIVKVSARGTRALVENGLDLSFALREAANSVGGDGGGHNVASGAAIPPGTAEQFISKVDEIVGEQLKVEA
jgi:single-stranded-DNA-specific exonuclease